MKMFRKMKGKLGFTLAEMLIVVALLAIIMAIAAPNVAKYSKSIKQRELDDSARSIYMAFEHQFASDVEMGVDLTNRFELGDPKPDVWGGIDKGIVKKPSKTRYTDAPDSMMGFYIHRENDSSGLFKNIVESELDHNNYIIEFNPETGDVFGVFYSEKVDFEVGTEYEYKSDSYDNDEKDVDGKPKSPFYRAVLSNTSGEYLIGYYGGDGKDGDRINDNTLPKPIVKIINKEKLVATISLPEDVEVDNHIKLELKDANNNPLNLKVDDDDYILPKGETLTLILDSLTPNPDDDITNISDSKRTFEFSASNMGIEPENVGDVSLTVTVFDPEGKMKDQTVEKTFNPLFADGTTVKTLDDGTIEYTAYIEYGRHLQNLDKAATAPTKAVVIKTIDFSNDAGYYEGWNNEDCYKDKKFTPLTIKKIDISAPGVEIKNINIKGIKGTDNKLRAGLFVRSADGFCAHDIIFRNPIIEGDNAWAGAVAAVLEKGGKAENITVINPQFDVTTDAGGIAGYARKCEIKNCYVYVEKTDGTDEGWSDPMNDPYSKYTISANRYAGGIVGGTEGGATDGAIIENCIAAVKVVSKSVGIDESAAGGLVGKASNTTVIDSAVFGHTYEGAFDGEFVKPDGTEGTFDLRDNVYGKYNAGGLIGKSYQGNKFSGIVFSTCSVMVGTDKVDTKVDTAYTFKKPTIAAGATVYTLGTAYKAKKNPDDTIAIEEKTTKSADTNIKSAADDEIAIPEPENPENPDTVVPVAQRYDSKVSAKFKFKVPEKVTKKPENETEVKMILRGDWPTEEESVSGFFYWEKEGTDYHVKALYYNGLDPDNENSEEPEKEVKELINNLCYEKDGNSITEYGYGAFMLDSEPDIKYQKATYTSNMGNIYKGTFGWDYAGSYGKIEYEDIQLDKILGDKITDTDVQNKIKKDINEKLKKEFEDSSIDVSIIDNIKYVMYKEKSGANDGWTKAGTVKATLDDHNYYFAPDYCALAASESVPFPTDENGYSLGKVIGVNKADIAPRALALGTCSYRADTTSNDKGSYIKYLKYLEYWNPYEVRTESQLRHIQQGCDNGEAADYKATRKVTTIENDINVAFKQSHDIKPASALNPIGKILKPKGFNGNYNGEISNHEINNLAFHGTYDGQSYRIIDAQFVEDDNHAAGLFAEADHATLQNIILFHEADSVAHFLPLVNTASPSTTAKFIGGIAAIVRNTTVENCVVSGYNITAQNLNQKASDLNNGLVYSCIGGIVGALDYFEEDETNHPYYNRVEYSLNGTANPYNKNSIRYCHANVSFEDAQVENLGGILGVDNSSLLKLYIENCYSIVHKGEKGIDPATYRIGGIVGEIYEACICRFRGCYSIFEGMPKKPQPGDKNYDAEVVNDVIYVHRMGLAQGDRWRGDSYKSENNQNYYVNDEGFANNADVGLNSKGDPAYMGEGVSYKDLLKKLIPLASDSNYEAAKAANLADKTYIKANEPIEKGQPGAYPLMAFTVDVTDGQTTNDETTDKIPYRPIYRNDFSKQGSDLGYENASLGKFVHYGPWPEVPGVVGDLVRGPLAGIFDVRMYNDGQCDGLLSYNRSGLLCSFDNVAEYATESKYVGVFFCNPLEFDTNEKIKEFKTEMCVKYKDDNVTIDDPNLFVYADNTLIENAKLVPFQKYLKSISAQTSTGIREADLNARAGYYKFKYKGIANHGNDTTGKVEEFPDEYFQTEGGKDGANVHDCFNAYVLLDKNGNLIERKDVSRIKICYKDEESGIIGTLIYADFDKDKDQFISQLPDTSSLGEAPKVIAFIAGTAMNDSNKNHKEGYPYYISPYVAYARMSSSNSAFGELGDTAASQAYVGIAIPKTYKKYIESKDLIFNVAGVRAKLIPWGYADEDRSNRNGKLGDISNLDDIFTKFGKIRNDYDVYYVGNLKNFATDNAINNPYSISVQWGSDQIMHYSYSDFKFGCAASGQQVKTTKSLMPKIGIGPLYYSTNQNYPGRGYIRAGVFAEYEPKGTTSVGDYSWQYKEHENIGDNTLQANSFIVDEKSCYALYIKGDTKKPTVEDIKDSITVKIGGKEAIILEDDLSSKFVNLEANTLVLKVVPDDLSDLSDEEKANPTIEIYYKQNPDVASGEVAVDGESIIKCKHSDFDKGGNLTIPKIALAGIYKEGESNNYLQGFVYDPADTTNEDHTSEKGNLAGKTVEKLNRYVLAVDSAIAKDIDAKLVTVEVTRKVPNKDNPDKPVEITIQTIIKEKVDGNVYKNVSELGYGENPPTYEIVLNGKYDGKDIEKFEEGDLIKVYYAGVQVMEKKVSEFYTPKSFTPEQMEEFKANIGFGVLATGDNSGALYLNAQLANGDSVDNSHNIWQKQKAVIIVKRTFADADPDIIKKIIVTDQNHNTHKITLYADQFGNIDKFNNYYIYEIVGSWCNGFQGTISYDGANIGTINA